MKIIRGGITAPKGFVCGAARAGLKKKGDDVCLIYSLFPAVADGVFTQNQVEAAPVTVSRAHLRQDLLAQAVIANSGCANCCTGERGLKDAARMAAAAARHLGIKKEDVLVASTGVIGRYLAIRKIEKIMPGLVKKLNQKNSLQVAKAIMTTDTFAKEYAVEIKVGHQANVRIGAVAKGAGMIHPNMATMLCFITTDIYISRRALKSALQAATARSFNAVTVDGDMSTNDSVIILANGAAGNQLVDKDDREFKVFAQALELVMKELAAMIVRDGEGATKFIEIEVKHCPSEWQALKIGRRIASSALFKTCVYGGDPNWGRVAAALGSAGVRIKRDRFDIYLGRRQVVKNGVTLGVDKSELKDAFRGKEVRVCVDLKMGRESATVWTCDLTEKYIKINAQYPT